MSSRRALLQTSGLAAAALLATVPSVAYSRATDGTISTFATVTKPTDLAYRAGDLYVADPTSARVRRVESSGAVFTDSGTGTIANGCGDQGSGGDLGFPSSVTAYKDGYLVSDEATHCIRYVSPAGIRRFAGNSDGQPGLAGDGGAARGARVTAPGDTVVMPDGSVLIADAGNGRVRRVSPGGTITTFAGTTPGDSGDGGPATAAQLRSPSDLAVFPDGTVLITDTAADRVRKVTPDGIITTVAGGNGGGFSGDGDPAVTAQVDRPHGLLPLTNGGFLVVDTAANRVRRVTPLGAIFTVAGGGTGPDGGLARDAALDGPVRIAARPGGGFAIADTNHDAVRVVTDVGAVPGAQLRHSLNVEPAAGAVTVNALPLNEEDLVPLGAAIDARAGRLTIAVRRGTGALDPAQVYAGSFVARQRNSGADPITDLTMTDPVTCPAQARAFQGARPLGTLARIAKKGKKKRRKGKRQRQLWVDGDGGRYRVKGRYVGALERGTTWRVEDSCTSSTVTVREGRVAVRDLARGRTKIVRAGRSLTVFAP